MWLSLNMRVAREVDAVKCVAVWSRGVTRAGEKEPSRTARRLAQMHVRQRVLKELAYRFRSIPKVLPILRAV
jgi:hypothetical protein